MLNVDQSIWVRIKCIKKFNMEYIQVKNNKHVSCFDVGYLNITWI